VEPLPLGDQGVIYISADGSRIEVLDSLLGAPRILQPPPGTAVFSLALHPGEEEVATWLYGPDGIALAITSLARADFRIVHRLEAGRSPAILSWTREGWLHFAQWDQGDPGLTLLQVRPTGGVPTVRVTLPRSCNSEIVRVAIAAPRGVCYAEDTRSDIWQVDLLGLIR
jgi:hypothetical protein